MKKAIYISIVVFIFSCKNEQEKGNIKNNIKNEYYSIREKSIDKELLILKNHLFIIYLNKLNNLSNLENGISNIDSCYIKTHIQDVSTHQSVNTSQYNLKYIYDDKNSQELIKKWLFKSDFDLIPIENNGKIIHSYNYYKALEFYNSSDINSYLDSVKIVELKVK